MKRLLGALAAFVISTAAFADVSVLRVGARQYGTGYLAKPKSELGSTPYYSPSPIVIEQLPDSYDARDEGLATPIKDQGSCGSCWSFARARAFETALLKDGHPESVDLAEQDALVNDKSAYGCQGGFMDASFEVEKGVTTEALCPYRASGRYACNGAKYAKATRWALLGTPQRAPTVDELRAAIVQYGTIFVTVAASNAFMPGADGKVTRCSGRGLNHMVTLQGYRKKADGKYEFLIGNSWGKQWGAQGYGWSEQGCNQLASVAGDAAGFIYFESEDAADPEPQPVKLDLPLEIVVRKGSEVALQVRPKEGVTYLWSTGTAGERIFVTPSASTTYTLEATDEYGAVTSQEVKVTVK